MDLAVEGNFVFCLIIVVIFIGLRRAYMLRVEGWIFTLSNGGGKPQRDGTIFMGEVEPSSHHIKILIWQL